MQVPLPQIPDDWNIRDWALARMTPTRLHECIENLVWDRSAFPVLQAGDPVRLNANGMQRAAAIITEFAAGQIDFSAGIDEVLDTVHRLGVEAGKRMEERAVQAGRTLKQFVPGEISWEDAAWGTTLLLALYFVERSDFRDFRIEFANRIS